MLNEQEQLEKQSRLLAVALEILRRSLTDSIAFTLGNRDRTRTGGDTAPPWSRAALEASLSNDVAFSPSIPKAPTSQRPIPTAADSTTTPNVYGVAAPTPPAAQPTLPPISLTPGDVKPIGFAPTILPPSTSGFGLGSPKESTVPAYDRPQAVIVVGPNPLPVKFDKALAMPATTPRAERAVETNNTTFRAMSARFLAVLGPLTVLSATLQSAGSGMSTFQKSLQVLGAALSPILLPVFLTLSATILTVSDIISARLTPALKGFYEWMLKMGLAGGEKKASEVADAADTASAARNLFRGELPRVADMPRLLDTAVRNIDPSGTVAMFQRNIFSSQDLADRTARTTGFGRNFGEWTQRAGLGGPTGNGAATAPGTRSLTQSMTQNMSDALKSLIHSIGPKASYTGLGEVNKQATLALLNQDPLEIRAAEMIIKSIEEFQRAFTTVANSSNPQPQTNRAGIMGAVAAMMASGGTTMRAP